MKFTNKTIGIWGYGRVGTAAAHFFSQRGARVIIYDAHPLATQNCPFEMVPTLADFFSRSDALLPSPGIDTRAYRAQYQGTWLTEVDLFHAFFHKKIIGITGSVGKTTITHFLTQTLTAAGWRVQAAGNIGLPMLSLIDHHHELDAVILELSSFQLEYVRSFAPDLAIWANLYPNHLDRHSTMHDYFLAKYNIVKHQTRNQKALISNTLQSRFERCLPKGKIHFFNPREHPHTLSASSFTENGLIVEKALSFLAVPLPHNITLSPLAHRCELVIKKNAITVINDSKSTTPASTLAALESINAPRTLLFLGGLSKGIDRSELIKTLARKPLTIFCFGAEAQQLFTLCQQSNIPAFCHTALEDAVTTCMKIVKPCDTILFSPAGSSFDAFKNYEERGNVFKKIILAQKIFSDCY